MGTQLGAMGADRKSSRLVEIMRAYAGARFGAGVGFRSHPDSTKRTVALVASVAPDDWDGATAAIRAGADAIEARIESADDLRAVDLLAGRVSVPLGLLLAESMDDKLPAEAAEAKVDWIRLPLTADLSSTRGERPARIISVPSDLDISLVRGLNGLAVEAVLVQAGGITSGGFTYADAVRFRAFGELIKKPLLLVGRGEPMGSVLAAEHLGADALLIREEEPKVAETVMAYRVALEDRASRSR